MSNNRIKAAREAAHLSQGDLAAELKVTRQTISAYERGLREPRLDVWKHLSDALSVSIPYLQGISSDPIGIDETIANTMTSRDFKKFLEDFERENKTPEDAERMFALIDKAMNNETSLKRLRLSIMNQLLNSIEALELEKMDTSEMLTLDDAIKICTAFYNGFHSNEGLVMLFEDLLSRLRSIIEGDGQVDYVKAEFMSSFEQLLDGVTAKHS